MHSFLNMQPISLTSNFNIHLSNSLYDNIGKNPLEIMFKAN